MDPQKELAVLKYVTAIWSRDVTDILQLRDGSFFLHVVDLLDHDHNNNGKVDTDNNRLLHIKEFLQDFYGDSVIMDDYLHFDDIIHEGSLFEIRMELAKIAVVLFGIGILDNNRKYFMDAALQLPIDMQNHVLSMIQSVVLPNSTEVVLSNKIEKTLRKVTSSSPPILNKLTTDSFNMDPNDLTSTPCCKKIHVVDPASERRTPLRSTMSVLNQSFHDISSPFKCLNIKSPSSPLFDFVQSPQLIQKAVLKQKDLELRKVHERLIAETLLKEEAQLALRDSQSMRVTQDIEVAKLQKRILEIHNMQESHVELIELQCKYQQLEAELLSMKERVLSLQTHRGILEEEILHQTEENSRLNEKVNSLEMECSRHKDLSEMIGLLEVEAKSQELELVHFRRLQSQWEEEKAGYDRSLKTAREMDKRLRNELQELHAKQSDNALLKGESMDIVVDIQMGEVRCQLNETIEENCSLKKQLESSKREIDLLKKQTEQHRQQMKMMTETNSCLSSTLVIERDTIVKMKKRLENVETNYKVIKDKLEASIKDKENTAAELSSLRTELQEYDQQQHKYKQQLDYSQQKLVSEDRGCDGSILSPIEPIANGNGVFFKRHTGSGCQEPDSSVSAMKSQSTQAIRSSTTSLHSILPLKEEHLSEMFPNALSCASEPEFQVFDWDRLSQLSTSADRNDPPTLDTMKNSRENNSVKPTRTPMKREIADSTSSSNSHKQRRSGGTVIYFPLDPKGPIYPPPRPSTCTRRMSGRFLPTTYSTSSATLHSNNGCATKQPHFTPSVSSVTSLATSELHGTKSASSPHRQSKYTPAKRHMGRLRHTYKYKVNKNSNDKLPDPPHL